MNVYVCAVAKGLRGDKGEPGSPGLPGFSGPKGPPVSGAFDKTLIERLFQLWILNSCG